MPQTYDHEVATVCYGGETQYEVHASYDVPKDEKYGLAAGHKITYRVGFFDSLEEAQREVDALNTRPKWITLAGAKESDLLSAAS